MASISEAQRAKMFTSLSKQIGTEEAEVLTTALNLDGQLATRDELRTEILAVREDMRSEFAAVRDEMRSEFAAVRNEMRSEFAAVRDEMRSEFAAVRKEMAEMRERFASANRALLFQLLAMQMSLFGLVIAGAKLLG
jgi:hypothetical protein